MLGEHRLFEERCVARKLRGNRRCRAAQRAAQHRGQACQLLARDRLVERDADARVTDASQVEALRQRLLHQRIGIRGLDRDRVEERVVQHAMAALPRRIGQHPRLQIDAPAMRFSPSGPCHTA